MNHKMSLTTILEQYFVASFTVIKTENDIYFSKEPIRFWIESILHAVISFPNRRIFNCNPRDYPMKKFKLQKHGIKNKQIEISYDVYEKYCKGRVDEKTGDTLDRYVFENDLNCILWCEYYLWWLKFENNDEFKCDLEDLEEWCRNSIVKLGFADT